MPGLSVRLAGRVFFCQRKYFKKFLGQGFAKQNSFLPLRPLWETTRKWEKKSTPGVEKSVKK